MQGEPQLLLQAFWPRLTGKQFYLDDLNDPLTMSALRMLVQDLLILFSAGNEGVINVLGAFPLERLIVLRRLTLPIEHYFEMSRVDAESALAVYRHFCKQCEKVVEFLGVAKKLSNLLNVPIPNMKHVSTYAFHGDGWR
jgi:phosphatidylinositol-binding clathrin assembly protein